MGGQHKGRCAIYRAQPSTGPNEVSASPTGQWGDRLSVGVTDALAARLNHLQSRILITTAQSQAATPQMLVQVVRFDVASDGGCTLVARWRVLAANHRTTLASEQGKFLAVAVSKGDAATAGVMTQVIDQLAGAIAATLAATLAAAPGRLARQG